MLNTLHKSERLSSLKEIDSLVKRGSSLFYFPFKVVYQFSPVEGNEPGAVKLLISVPKRSFKRAVKRNYIKRRIREAYRLNKSALSIQGENLNILFVYVGKQVAEYDFIEPKIKDILTKLNALHEQKND